MIYEADERVYLRHILDAIRHIQEYTDGGEQPFRQRPLVQDGVIRQLEIIGEAVKHLPAALRQRHADIPWQDITGTRDILIHHYFDVNVDEVWRTVQSDIPVLKKRIVEILGSYQPDDP